MADVGRMILPSGRKEAASHDRSNGCESMQGHREKTPSLGKLASGNPGRTSMLNTVAVSAGGEGEHRESRGVNSPLRPYRAGRRCGRDLLVRCLPGAQLASAILAQAKTKDGGFVALICASMQPSDFISANRRVRAAQYRCIIVSDMNLLIDFSRRGGGLVCQMTTVQIVHRPRLSGLNRSLRVR